MKFKYAQKYNEELLPIIKENVSTYVLLFWEHGSCTPSKKKKEEKKMSYILRQDPGNAKRKFFLKSEVTLKSCELQSAVIGWRRFLFSVASFLSVLFSRLSVVGFEGGDERGGRGGIGGQA